MNYYRRGVDHESRGSSRFDPTRRLTVHVLNVGEFWQHAFGNRSGGLATKGCSRLQAISGPSQAESQSGSHDAGTEWTSAGKPRLLQATSDLTCDPKKRMKLLSKLVEGADLIHSALGDLEHSVKDVPAISADSKNNFY